MISGAEGGGIMLLLETLLSLLAEFVVWTLTLTSPVGLLVVLFAASLIPIPASRMKSTAPPAHSRGILRCENWLRDGREGKKVSLASNVMLFLMNSV